MQFGVCAWSINCNLQTVGTWNIKVSYKNIFRHTFLDQGGFEIALQTFGFYFS